MDYSWDAIGISGEAPVVVKHVFDEAQKPTSVIKRVTSHAEAKRETRKAAHKVVEKEISRYHGVIKQTLETKPGETYVYGASAEREKTPAETLAVELEHPVNKSESIINQIMGQLSKGRREIARNLFPKAEGHSEMEVIRLTRRLRQLLAEDQRDNARKKATKSKNSRRFRRKEQEKEQAKLMERLTLENPEEAEKMRQEWEIKRAEARMMLDNKARKQWASMARRFGGQALDRTISDAHKDAEQFRAFLDKMSGKIQADDDSDDEGSNVDGTPAADSVSPAEEPVPFGADISDDENSGGEEDFLARKLEAKQRAAPTAEEVKPTRSSEPAANPDMNLSLFSKKKRRREEPAEEEAKPAEDDRLSYFKKTPTRTAPKEVVEARPDAESDVLSKSNLVRLAFNVEDDETAFAARLEEEEMEEVEKEVESVKAKVVPGWGNWAGEGYEDPRVAAEKRKRAQLQQELKRKRREELKQRGLVKINPEACKPPASYVVKVPSTVLNKAQYLADLKQPIGEQFVPQTLHRLALTPKHTVIKGRVIAALKAEKRRDA